MMKLELATKAALGELDEFELESISSPEAFRLACQLIYISNQLDSIIEEAYDRAQSTHTEIIEQLGKFEDVQENVRIEEFQAA